jgi:hypothetical protein
MIISDEQVQKALEYLQKPKGTQPALATPDSADASELVDRARDVVASTPEVRDDRVEHAREALAEGEPSSTDVAEKMIGRIISDSIR